jgi:hypothetical protein
MASRSFWRNGTIAGAQSFVCVGPIAAVLADVGSSVAVNYQAWEVGVPFDVTRSVSETHGDFYPVASLTALPFALETTDVDAKRRAGIQRAVSVIAGILFGALGALAGASVVILMLVALVIPATIAVALAMMAALTVISVFAVWMRRRASRATDADPAELIALPV